MQKSGFIKKLFRYVLLIVSNFAFFITVILSISYLHPTMYIFIWKQNLYFMLSMVTVAAVIWIGTGIAYILTE